MAQTNGTKLDDTNTFLTTSDNDHGTYLWITILLSVCFTTIITVARLILRRTNLWKDDWLLAGAQVVTWASAASAFFSLANGLGKAIDLVEARRESRQANGLRASQVLLLVALALSEASMILFTHRVFTMRFKHSRLVIFGLHILNGLWAFISIIVICAGCSPKHIFAATDASECHGDNARWKAVYVILIVLDLAISIIPVVFIAFVQSMPMKHFLAASLAFLPRLALIPLAVLFMAFYSDWLGAGRSGTGLVRPLAIQQCHLGWSLISASVPSVRRFTRVFGKRATLVGNDWAVGPDRNLESTSPPTLQREPQPSSWIGLSVKRLLLGRKSTVEQTTTPPKASKPIVSDPSPDGMTLRPEKLESNYTISHSESSSMGDPPPHPRPCQSRENIIRKHMRWDVTHTDCPAT